MKKYILLKLFFFLGIHYYYAEVFNGDTIPYQKLEFIDIDFTTFNNYGINYVLIDTFNISGNKYLLYTETFDKIIVIQQYRDTIINIKAYTLPSSDFKDNLDTVNTKYLISHIPIEREFPLIMIKWESLITGSGGTTKTNGIYILDFHKEMCLLNTIYKKEVEYFINSIGDYGNCYCEREIDLSKSGIFVGNIKCGGVWGNDKKKKEIKLSHKKAIKKCINTSDMNTIISGSYKLYKGVFIKN